MNRQIHNRIVQAIVMAGIVTVVCCQQTLAADFTVTENVSKRSVQVAEPFTIEWSVTAAEGAKVTFPATGKQLGEFDVLAITDLFDIPSDNGTETRSWTRRMTLETIHTGELNIPELEIQVSDSNGSHVVQSKPIMINVASVLEDRSDPTQFRDIQSVVDVALPVTHSSSWVFWTMGGISGLAVLAIAGLLLTRRVTYLTPELWAMEQLDELEKLIQAGTTTSELAALEVSRIAQKFLQFQLGLPESEETTQELLHEVKLSECVSDEVIERLNTLFMLTEQAKFAGLKLNPADYQSVVRDTRKLIQRISVETKTVATIA